jgi:NRPS condensation-like uncharacterized protein
MKIIVNYSTTKKIEMNNEDFDRLYKIASHFSSISSVTSSLPSLSFVTIIGFIHYSSKRIFISPASS